MSRRRQGFEQALRHHTPALMLATHTLNDNDQDNNGSDGDWCQVSYACMTAAVMMAGTVRRRPETRPSPTAMATDRHTSPTQPRAPGVRVPVLYIVIENKIGLSEFYPKVLQYAFCGTQRCGSANFYLIM